MSSVQDIGVRMGLNRVLNSLIWIFCKSRASFSIFQAGGLYLTDFATQFFDHFLSKHQLEIIGQFRYFIITIHNNIIKRHQDAYEEKNLKQISVTFRRWP